MYVQPRRLKSPLQLTSIDQDPTLLADAIYPMSRHLNFEYNALAKIWLPAAIKDELLLHTILFSSALHFRSVAANDELKDAGLLMKVVLDRLNRRLYTKTLSDATIGAVSCLAMCEVRPLGATHHSFRSLMACRIPRASTPSSPCTCLGWLK